MASLQDRKRKNGKTAYVIQFSLGGVRRSVFLNAKYTKRVAKETSLYVDELATAREFDAPLDRRVMAWLENIDDRLRERLGRAGLIATNKNVSIGELIELYMEAESSSMKPATLDGKRVRFRQSAQRLDFAQRASRLEVADVVRFKTKLDADFSEATRAGILKAMSRVYSWCKSLGYVSSNPFSGSKRLVFEQKEGNVRLAGNLPPLNRRLRRRRASRFVGVLSNRRFATQRSVRSALGRRRLDRRAFYRSVAEDGTQRQGSADYSVVCGTPARIGVLAFRKPRP